MISTRWLEKRKTYWARLEQLVDRSNKGGISALDHRELQELGLLYRQTASDLATVRALTGDKPVSAKGRFALGRALLAQGDRAGAQALIRDAWRTEPMPFDAEEEILETFGDLITRADDKARMEHWLYANDTNTALRAAIRLGGNEPAIAKARAAVNEKASNAKALIEGLPSSAHQDAGVLFSRIQLLRRANKIAEAAELMLSAAENVGIVKKDPKSGDWVATHKGGALGYLEWAAVHRADRFIALMARVAPKHVIAQVQHSIMTREETDAELKDLGLPPELIEHLRVAPQELDYDEDPDPYKMVDVTPSDDTGK